jgi:hypothetical protein
MNKQIIADIAADAAELGRALASEGIRTLEAQAEIVAGAMPGFVAYETAVTRAVDRTLETRDDPRIPGLAEPGER